MYTLIILTYTYMCIYIYTYNIIYTYMYVDIYIYVHICHIDICMFIFLEDSYWCIYVYIYIRPGCQVSRPPSSPKGRVPQDGLSHQVEYACQAYAYAFICMSMCICISTSTYACIVHACRHIRAWHACTYSCLHGMHAYVQASYHVHLHTTPTGMGGHLPIGGTLPRYIL